MPFFGVPIRNGLPIGLGSVAGFGVQQFDPSQLFEGGTVAGAWYDPSDLTTLFTTSAGTTPVAMPGQGAAVPVGLMLDKSQGLVLGSELVTNGDFSGGSTSWTLGSNWTVTGGAATTTGANSDPTTGRPLTQSASLVVGRTYEVSFELVANNFTGTSCGVRFQDSGNINLQIVNILPSTPVGVYKARLAATGTNITITTSAASPAGSFTIDNISVKEIPGNHAIAANNTTARPELRARVNLLVATATLSTQSVTTQATNYTLSFAGAGSITLSGTATGSYSAGTHTITCTAGTLTLTVSGTVTTADLRPANSGALLPAYQAVVDANTYDTSGFPLYLFFDGIDDSMYTPANLNLSGTDKVAVFAGVRKLSDAAAAILAELSADRNANNGAWTALAPGNVATPERYAFNSKGTLSVAAITSVAAYTAPVTNVFTGIGDISGDSAILRANGTQVGSNTGDQGTGNFGTYPLFIGARNNAGSWFNGHLYSLAVVGSAVSGGNIAAMESWVAGKTGIAI